MALVLKRLKQVREQMGISQEELARKSNGDFSTRLIQRSEAGKGTELLKAKAIAKVLKIKLDDLI